MRIGLFNDSFPPTIDGVAQVVKNYADILHRKGADVTVVTPSYRGVKDHYPYEVVRYQSVPANRRIGYRIGNPFDPEALVRLRAKKFELMHVHSPFASSVLVNMLNHRPEVPVVLTYHTKFDVDISTRVPGEPLQKVAMRFLLDNVRAADEIWVVTEGCGKALRNIGYDGEYRVMGNGTDFAYGQAAPEAVELLRKKYAIPEDTFVFLFVGRMMWYKNTRILLQGLQFAKEHGLPFRALMVGDGYDRAEIEKYAGELGLSGEVIFPGSIRDREQLRVYYTLADLFLFPSTFDTSGIVVKEAAACDCPAMLVRGSCAAEGTEDNVTAFLAEENGDSCGEAILRACQSRKTLETVGHNAGKKLYVSWENWVEVAYARYEKILENWNG